MFQFTWQLFVKQPHIAKLPLHEQTRLYRLEEQRQRDRMEYYHRMFGSLGSAPAGDTSFSVSVGGSIISGATVVIGWINDLTYTNANNQACRISERGSGLSGEIIFTSVVENQITNAAGIATFPSFNPQWAIEDYTDYFAGRAAGPKTLYAPITTYGGVSDTGYDATPMRSNAGVPKVNPITSLITSIKPYEILKEDSESDAIINLVGEWLGKSLTANEKASIRSGNVTSDIYESLVEPVKKIQDLFTGLDVSDKAQNIDVGLSQRSLVVETKYSTISALNISGIYSFSNYYAKRLSGGPKKDAKTYAKENISNDTLATILGYNLTDNNAKNDIIEKIYDRESTSSTFDAIKTSYSLTKKEGDEPKNPGYLINITQASELGFAITTTESINEGTAYLLTDIEGTSSTWTASIADQGNNNYVVDVLGSTGWAALSDGIYTIQADLASSKTQKSNSITFSSKNNSFTDTVSGADIATFKGVDKEPPSGGGSTLTVNLIKLSKTVTFTELNTINSYPHCTYSDEIVGTLHIYWTGAGWVIDSDTDPKEVYAYGPKDGSLSGDFVSAVDGTTIEAIVTIDK